MTPDEFTSELVLRGYCAGLFPMGEPDGQIAWYSPDPRGVFEFDRFQISRSLRQTVRKGLFEIRFDTAFDSVMRCCAERPDEGTWITEPIFRVYNELHQAGLAHSVEAWQGTQLAGGLYGVTIGAAYFGESMFFRVRDASKVALVALMRHLQTREYELVDTQWLTPHLASLGAVEIPRREYLRRLRTAIDKPRSFRADQSPNRAMLRD